jgi:hypothetical protein
MSNINIRIHHLLARMLEFCCGVFATRKDIEKRDHGDADMGNGQSIEMTDNPGFYDASEHQMIAEPVEENMAASTQAVGK